MRKSYIAQAKRTVPQLELMGAVTAVGLDQLLRKEFQQSDCCSSGVCNQG